MRIAICPDRNTPGRRDATGAFIPCAERWADTHGGRVVRIDMSKPARWQAARVIDVLTGQREAFAPRVAFFCHGFARRISFGLTLENVGELARSIVPVGPPGSTPAPIGSPRVALFACSSGDGPGPGGDGGYADALCDALANLTNGAAVVIAHTTAGHTTRNPYKRRFASVSRWGSMGGAWIVAPRSALWPRWRDAMRRTDLWLDMLEREPAELLEAIHG